VASQTHPNSFQVFWQHRRKVLGRNVQFQQDLILSLLYEQRKTSSRAEHLKRRNDKSVCWWKAWDRIRHACRLFHFKCWMRDKASGLTGFSDQPGKHSSEKGRKDKCSLYALSERSSLVNLSLAKLVAQKLERLSALRASTAPACRCHVPRRVGGQRPLWSADCGLLVTTEWAASSKCRSIRETPEALARLVAQQSNDVNFYELKFISTGRRTWRR